MVQGWGKYGARMGLVWGYDGARMRMYREEVP